MHVKVILYSLLIENLPLQAWFQLKEMKLFGVLLLLVFILAVHCNEYIMSKCMSMFGGLKI